MTLLRPLILLALTAVPMAGFAQTCNPGNPRVAPDSRYVVTEPVPGQAVVTDLETGLMWARCAVGQTGAACTGSGNDQLTWGQALTVARESTHAGFDDWRVPNIEELVSLVETGCHTPAINTVVFPNIAAGGLGPWSSTTRATVPGQAWRIWLNDGQTSSLGKATVSSVRLVRGGSALSGFDAGGRIFRNGFE